MTADREVELKLALPPDGLERLRRHPVLKQFNPGPSRTAELISTYFDTPAHDLLNAGIAVRIRQKGKKLIQTVKCGAVAGLHLDVREFEAPASRMAPDLSLVPDEVVRAGIEKICAKPGLRPVFETHVRRSTRLLTTAGGTVAELAFDLGDIRAGKARAPLSEVELELKDGPAIGLYQIALALNEAVPGHILTATKSHRALMLARGEKPVPERAADPGLTAAMSVDGCFAAILWACLNQLYANEQAFRAGETVEAVHQMRVAIRRLRSLWSMFGRRVKSEAGDQLIAGVKELAQLLGRARDLDVFLKTTLPPVMAGMPHEPGLLELKQRGEKARKAAYQAIGAHFASSRHTALMLSLGAYAANAGWRRPGDLEQAALLARPAESFAARILTKRMAKVLAAGENIAALAALERHALRIQLKKLRYAAEFLTGLFPGRRTKPMIAAIMQRQERLGYLNDMAVAGRLTDELRRDGKAGETSPLLAHAAGLVVGWHAVHATGQWDKLVKAWPDFADEPRFWEAPASGSDRTKARKLKP